MKQILVPIELNLIENVVQVIGQAVHKNFSHSEINNLLQALINKAQAVMQEHQNKQKTEEVKENAA